MRLLLDTHAFLWFVAGDKRLSPAARQAMEQSGAELVLSAASVWEMAIKLRLGRLSVPEPLEAYIAGKLREGFQLLPVEWEQAARVATLPFHHRDPFDRLLACQALMEALPMVTADAIFHTYGVKVIW
ncbi:MAG: type II toxin-antitoxin system VapC family toxin [Kiritimatiellaeota bacterium]|nr:type II toxin-antitoxin system VapC family toxin [Kiritimatiellota bacterium]